MNNNVLIIKDGEHIFNALEVRLNARGYQTSTAFDAIMDMPKAVNTPLDAIPLDITMPGGNGLTLAEQLKTSGNTQDLPIIFFTASKQPDLRKNAMALGETAFFENPYNFDYLVAVLRASIEHPKVRLSI